MWKSPEPAPALLPITLRTYSPSYNYYVTDFRLRNRIIVPHFEGVKPVIFGFYPLTSGGKKISLTLGINENNAKE